MLETKKEKKTTTKKRINSKDIKRLLENLTGQRIPLENEVPIEAVRLFNNKIGLGFSQMNELLLNMGYDRVSESFFQYLIDGNTEYKQTSAINSFEVLKRGVDRFQKIAILLFGNVKYGFKLLSQQVDDLEGFLESLKPIDVKRYKNRHDPVLPVDPINPEDTYYLGYIIEKELKRKIEKDPNDKEAQRKEKHRKKIVKKGEKNYKAYLSSDHLDVYVATSMRQPHEYILVNKLAKKSLTIEL